MQTKGKRKRVMGEFIGTISMGSPAASLDWMESMVATPPGKLKD
jgi:hypothetical protein